MVSHPLPPLALPLVAAVVAGDEGGHRLVGTARLHLVVGRLLALALAALEDALVGVAELAVGLHLQLLGALREERSCVGTVRAQDLRRVLRQLARLQLVLLQELGDALARRCGGLHACARLVDGLVALELSQEAVELLLVDQLEVAAVPAALQRAAPLRGDLGLRVAHGVVHGGGAVLDALDHVVEERALDVARHLGVLHIHQELLVGVLAQRVLRHCFRLVFFWCGSGGAVGRPGWWSIFLAQLVHPLTRRSRVRISTRVYSFSVVLLTFFW